MIILPPKIKWVRDKEVVEIVEYFRRPEKNSWDKLNEKECKVLFNELDNCRKEFTYAARNYFWVETKEKKPVLFRLWDSQEIILDKLNWLKNKHLPQKVLVMKARRLGCSTFACNMMIWSTGFFGG